MLKTHHTLVVARTLLLLSVAGAGCSGGTSRDSGIVARGDLSAFSEEPLYKDTLHLVEDLRVGVADGDVNYVFSEIRSLAVGPAGDIYVFEPSVGIRHYDPSGTYVGLVAGLGQGPEEVRGVISMAVSPSDVLAAYDLGNARVMELEPGRPGHTFRRPEGAPRYGEDALVYHRDGSLWIGINPPFPEVGGIAHPRPIFARVDPAAGLINTIFTPSESSEGCPEQSAWIYVGGFWEDKREPWVPKVKWALGPDGVLAVGCPADYTFQVLHSDGTRTHVTRGWTPTFAPEEELRFFQTWGNMPPLPRQRPAYTKILVPGDGQIWVWRSGPNSVQELDPERSARTGETSMWVIATTGAFDVFDVEGHWLGVVDLPPGVRYSGFPVTPPIVIRGDTVWAVAWDSSDVEYVVRYHVQWP
ncbi:MAG: hypothetical protein ABIF09_05465 [Gemmatimonadota bacterium]